MRRTILIGDVHGCVEELQRLLDACGVTDEDRVIQVGDLVAKGPDSAGVLRVCRERGIEAVLGNHDGRVLELRGKLGEGPPESDHETVAATLTSEDWAYLEALPLWRALPEYDALVVHAGLLPGVPLERQRKVDLVTLRTVTPDGRPSSKGNGGVPWASLWRGPELVIFGHDAARGLQQHPHAIGLDTGCVYGGTLTALVLPERRFVQVPAARVYSPPRRS